MDYLTRDFDERVEKVKAVHRWITTNIRLEISQCRERNGYKELDLIDEYDHILITIISEHVCYRYDVQGFQTREFGKSSAEDVLKKKCAGYHGYCNLFAAMCR